jgi:deoxyribodipyrimidine photo-lyase
VPELARLPDAFIHSPWDAPPEILSAAGIVLGQTYPMRMVDHMAAADEARTRIAAVRRAPGHAATADEIQLRHGSRRSGIAVTGQRRRAGARQVTESPAPPRQLSLDLFAAHAS